MTNESPEPGAVDIRVQVAQAIDALEQILPAQAPIRDFVHHNTLHGFQHLPFREAVAAATRRTGARGLLPIAEFREQFRRGRVTIDELREALHAQAELGADEPLNLVVPGAEPPVDAEGLRREDVYLAALLHPLDAISAERLHFELEDLHACERFQPDVPAEARAALLGRAQAAEGAAIADLWSASLDVLGLDRRPPHPEDLTETDPDFGATADTHAAALDAEAAELLERLIGRVGEDWTLRDLLRALTGADLMTHVHAALVRHLAAHIDQGLAAWHNPERGRGFYAAWRSSVERDLVWGLVDLPDWREVVCGLPDDALDALLHELRLLGLAEEKWPRYLERLALELPGWAGMYLWRQHHPHYGGAHAVPVNLIDQLAVRLVLGRLFAHGICRRRWRSVPSLPALSEYFRRHPAELLVRHALYSERLPEHLLRLARGLTQQATFSIEPLSDADWQEAAVLIAAWRRHPGVGEHEAVSPQRSAWPLFRLAQHLALPGAALRAIGSAGARELLGCLHRLDAESAGYIWLVAYERHYRDQVLGALAANHGRGAATGVPEAQLVFCMDDREEGLRRHLEEVNPALETFGAAGFFGVAVNWRGLDDTVVTPLCPIVVTPAHEAREVVPPGAEELLARHQRRRRRRLRWKTLLTQGTRRGVVSAALLSAAAAPPALLALCAKVLGPARIGPLVAWLRSRYDIAVATEVAFTAPAQSAPATPEQPRFGFTDAEQADRVHGLLRTIGLTSGFSPLVAVFGHGSSSENNPHMAAYDCGACSGRHGGPNARLFAAMANRPEVRAILAGRGVHIPPTTWFLGGHSNTGTSALTWFDAAALPPAMAPALAKLDADLAEAAAEHARERCRRFASAPAAPAPARARRHVEERSFDFSQARPELGHVTNACALIGRRSMSRGAFFDRRSFLISYDPTADPEGRVLEAILLAAGPVGAGISLEYYFSTVNNDGYGCGTKVVHNIAGLLGVMEGASSDLRTGLPRQMIEIHEAMRLLIVCEHRPEILSAITARQPALAELVGNGWVQLAAKNPDSADIHFYKPGRGWTRWQGSGVPLPVVERSADWYTGHSDALAPALIRRAILEAA